MLKSYVYNREKLIGHCRNLLGNIPESEKIIESIFWENIYIDGEEQLQCFYGNIPAGQRFNVWSFDPYPEIVAISKVPGFQRLAVTSHRVLNLSNYSDSTTFFKALNPKKRKQLRWLKNALPAQGITIELVKNKDDLDKFEILYAHQFPKNSLGSARNSGVKKIYMDLLASGTGLGWIMYDPDHRAIAAALGFFCGDGFNFTHLTRLAGAFDKFSPGFFLVYKILCELLDEYPECRYFFMGPGEYDYKRIFLGERMAVYRYEPDQWSNIFGLLKLWNRARKEKKALTVCDRSMRKNG